MKAQPNLHRFRVSLVVCAAACLGIAGALPHLFFSFDTGKLDFFENAWDESFYALVMSGKIANWNDYPVRALERLLLSLSGGPNFISAVLSDMIWPAAVAMAAGFLALTIVRGWLAVVPVIFCLVFASDILAFNSSVIYPPSLTVSAGLKLLALDVRKLFSDPYVSFLYVYRTPEPQLSLPFLFCYVALVIRFLRLSEIGSKDWVLLSCGGFVCVLIYPFLAIASLMISGLGAVSLTLTRRWKIGAGVLSITVICAVCFAVVSSYSHRSEADAMLFFSSLPLFAPSLVYSLILLAASVYAFRNARRNEAEPVFAILCFLIPLATLNQQVVTGLMVQTMNWERYVNYFSIVVGALILLARSDWPEGLLIRLRRIAPLDRFNATALMVGLLALFLYWVQLSTYRQYAHYNLVTAAFSEAADKFFFERPTASRQVTLDNVSYDALVRVRMKTPAVSINGYTDLVASLKSSTSRINKADSALAHRDWGFEHAARQGFSKSQYEARLVSQVDDQACWPDLLFHFSFLECAPYQSDFRTYFPSKLKQAIPSIADDYQEYLLRHINKQEVFGEALVLSTTPLQGQEASGLWNQELVGVVEESTRANGFAPSLTARVYAYWQRPI